ncbi:MAG TPA: hypothetical protein VF639_09595, partial [Hymenobacter sp.]
FGWGACFRRLARDYERLALTLPQFHFLACVTLLLAKGVFLPTSPSQALGHKKVCSAWNS